MKRILIVGKNSYIGNCIEKWLTQEEVDKYRIEKTSVRNDEWKKIDLSGYDAILYVAALVHIKEKKKFWPDYLRLNAELPYEFAKKAKQSGVAHFIFFSTKAVFRPNTRVVDDNTELVPVSLYGKSKLEGERRIRSIANDIFRVTVIRPPLVYGENCKGNFSKLVKLSKHIRFFPRVYNEQSMIYIWNLCELVKLIIEEPASDSIILPQDEELGGTTDIMVALWEERQEKYHLSSLLAIFVKLMMKLRCSSSLNKMFMNSVYDPKVSCYYDNAYCIYSFREAIRKMRPYN